MRRIICAIALCSALSASAFAQAARPTGEAKYGNAPADAVLSYNLLGLKLTNGGNENVGEIKDLVIEKGELVGYVLSVGGFLGMGTHYVDVTPASVSINYDANKKSWNGFINSTKDQLKAAPEFKYEGKFDH
jgi:hypothetical protein